MCYSSHCYWEGYMGDCTRPNYLLTGIKYGYCNCSYEDYKAVRRYLEKVKEIEERNIKIKKIKDNIGNCVKDS